MHSRGHLPPQSLSSDTAGTDRKPVKQEKNPGATHQEPVRLPLATAGCLAQLQPAQDDATEKHVQRGGGSRALSPHGDPVSPSVF